MVKKYTDHLGNTFSSQIEMAKYWRVPYTTFKARRNRSKWSLEKSLTTPLNEYSCIDHEGNVFSSQRKMAEYWNINYITLNARLNKGWSLKEALTVSDFTDPLGNIFKTQKEMIKYWGISDKTFLSRLHKQHLSLIQALNISIITNPRFTNINQTKYNLTVVKRIQLGKDVFECFIDNGDGTSTFKIMSYDMIDQYCLEQYKKLHGIS
jgi:hypothetical protein